MHLTAYGPKNLHTKNIKIGRAYDPGQAVKHLVPDYGPGFSRTMVPANTNTQKIVQSHFKLQ